MAKVVRASVAAMVLAVIPLLGGGARGGAGPEQGFRLGWPGTSSSSPRPRRAASTCCSWAIPSPALGGAGQGDLGEGVRPAEGRQLRHRRRQGRVHPVADSERRTGRPPAQGRRPAGRHQQHLGHQARPAGGPRPVLRGRPDGTVGAIRAKCPQTKVLLLAILPLDDGRAPCVKLANEAAAKLDDGKNVRFLDFGPKIAGPDGNALKEMLADERPPVGQGLPGVGRLYVPPC